MKKCKRCKNGGEFSLNKYKPDGFSDVCKQCSNEITQERRRRLDVMLIGVELYNVEIFSDLHKTWKENGFPPHLKPVVVNDRCMTKMDSKGLRSRKRTKVVMNGETVFNSIAEAVRKTGDSRLYIKWSSDNGAAEDGGNRWEIKK
jgi:hypothetical protein